MKGSTIPLGCPGLTLCCCAFWMVVICCATTDSTSMSIRLNSSKHAQAPALSRARHLGRECTWRTRGTSFQPLSDFTGEEALSGDHHLNNNLMLSPAPTPLNWAFDSCHFILSLVRLLLASVLPYLSVSCAISHPASPGQTLEELAHGHEVELVGAVEHNCLYGQGLPQVLCGLCFPCASWASWGTSKLEVQGSCQGQIAPVGMRADRNGPHPSWVIPCLGCFLLQDSMDQQLFLLLTSLRHKCASPDGQGWNWSLGLAAWVVSPCPIFEPCRALFSDPRGWLTQLGGFTCR